MKQINLKENPTKLPPIFMDVLIWMGEEKPYIGQMIERKESKDGITCKFMYFNSKTGQAHEVDSSAIAAWCHLPKLKK